MKKYLILSLALLTFNGCTIFYQAAKIEKSSDASLSCQQLIEEFEFFVTGSDTQRSGGSGANRQPTVTIYIKATEKGATTDKPYYIQTTVTQRTLNI